MTQIYSFTPIPTVSCGYYQALLDFLRQSMGDELLVQAGVQLETLANDPLHVADYLLLVDLANDNLSPDWGIDLGLRFRPATYGILGLLPLHCENLFEALGMVLRFESLVHDLGTSEVVNKTQVLHFSWHPQFHNPAQLKPIMESVLSGMQQFSSWLSAGTISFESLVLPSECQHEWLSAMQVAPIIKSGTLAFQVSMKTLMKPIPQADSDLKIALLNSAQLMMDKKQPAFIKTIVAWLDERLIDSECTLEQASELLTLSPRTLQRHLQSQGLNYQQLLMGFRKSKALKLLAQSERNLMQVSAQLGFKEQSSFSNAFKLWFGHSPMAFIKEYEARR